MTARDRIALAIVAAALAAGCGTDTIVAVSKPGAAVSPTGGGPRAPLHTEGRRIVDAAGNEVRLAGVNWFGLETGAFAPAGLGQRSMGSYLDQIVSLGFNSLRIPFSTMLLDPSSKPSGIDPVKNPELDGKDGLGVLDALVRAAASRGLAVILDRHSVSADERTPLWYTDRYDEQRFLDDFRLLASTYRNVPEVIAFNVHTDPHDPATWGDGNATTDFAAAATRAGNAILEANPNLLVMVQGIETVGDAKYWWGGNLAAAADHPVTLSVPGHVVYATVDYPASVSDEPWFSDPTYPANLDPLRDAMWGYLVKEDIAPVFVGGFGSRLQTDSDRQWFASVTAYIDREHLGYAYWAFNPDAGDTGGLLEDDRQTVRQDVLQKLQR